MTTSTSWWWCKEPGSSKRQHEARHLNEMRSVTIDPSCCHAVTTQISKRINRQMRCMCVGLLAILVIGPHKSCWILLEQDVHIGRMLAYSDDTLSRIWYKKLNCTRFWHQTVEFYFWYRIRNCQNTTDQSNRIDTQTMRWWVIITLLWLLLLSMSELFCMSLLMYI